MKCIIITAMCLLMICAVSVGAWNVVNNTENTPPTLVKLIEELSAINYDFNVTYQNWLEMKNGFDYLAQLEERVFYSENVSVDDVLEYLTFGNPIVTILYVVGYGLVLLFSCVSDVCIMVVQIFGIILHLFFGYAPTA